MALSANSVFEVQTGGNDTNGGGFVTGAAGTDYSLVAAKRTGTGADDSTTDAVAIGTTTITSATAVFGTTIVGNIVYFAGGTGSIAGQWRQVTARASTTSITIDAAIAASTGMTMNIGGALASPGMAGGVGLVSGNIIYIKAGTYTIASASTNIATGCFSSSLAVLVVQGYQTTRTDLGTAPLLQASGISTFTILNNGGADASTVNISVDGASLTSSRGFLTRGLTYMCLASNCTNSGLVASNNSSFVRCRATGCSTVAAFLNGNWCDCIAHDNTITGFSFALNGSSAVRCVSESNSGASSDGFDLTLGITGMYVVNCVAYNNGRDGIRISDDCSLLENNIAEGNAAFGINNANQDSVLFVNNATYNNTSGGINVGTGKGVLNIGAVALSGSPFTNAAGQDFSLNNTAGAGAACRAAGYPGALPVGGTGYLDIGALQHADPAGGGGGPLIGGRLVM